MPIYKQKEKNKDGVYKYKVRVNYTDSFGNHKQLTRTAWGAREAKELERQLTQQTDSHSITTGITLSTLFSEYCNSIQHEIRQTSLEKKQTIFKLHIEPVLGSKQLTHLNTKTLSDWKTYINEKGLRLQTRKNLYTEFRALLNYAVKMEYLSTNPLLKVGNFRDAYEEKPEIQFYTPEEFKLFRDAALITAEQTGYYDYYVFFCIAYYTGARKGEIHALRWSSIDNDYFSIKKSITQKLKGGDVETPPKNKSSIRTIQIPLPLMKILTEHKSRQQNAILSIGQKWSEDGFICGYYKSLRDSSLENENIKYAKASQQKKIRIHDFRHSHASLLINNGINALEIARRLGHSTVDQTLKTYSHLFPKESERALEILNSIE